MRSDVHTPEGKRTQLLDLYPSKPETVEACKRVCVKFDAVDVLPMLGVTA